MRILYICQDAGIPAFGRKGASTHIREVCRAWTKLGHSVHLVCADLGPDLDPGVVIETTEIRSPTAKILGADFRRALTDWRFRRRLPAIARAFKPEIIYERHSLYTGAAQRLARRLGIPHLLEANAVLSDEQRDRLHHPDWAERVERRIFRGADAIIPVSPGLREACERWGVPSEKIHTLPMAVDPDHFQPRARDPRNREAWGWSPHAPAVGYLGALTGWHRPDLFLEAAAAVHRDHAEVRFLVIGGSPQHIDRFHTQATAMGLSDVLVFTGAVPYAEVPELLAEMDIGTVPGAHQWSTPTKMFEYAAMGIPFVSVGTRNIRAVVTEGEGGLLVEPESGEALAEGVRALLGDSARRADLGQRGRTWILERHTWDRNARRLTELGQECLAARRSS